MATFEEKKAFYAARGVTAESMRVALGHGEEYRSMTEEEFEQYLSMCSEPDEILAREQELSNPDNYMWRANRIQEYPKTDPQFDAIFHAIKNIRDSGIDVGPDADAWLDTIIAIKQKYPKPE